MATPDDYSTLAERALERGKAAYGAGDFACATEQFRDARPRFQKDGDHVQATRTGVYLSQALIESGALGEAEALLDVLAAETAQRYRTHVGAILEGRGRIAHMRGDVGTAADLLASALRLYGEREFRDPQEAACWNAAAAVHISTGSYAAAWDCLQRARKICAKLPDDVGPRLPLEVDAQRGLVAAAMGRYQEGIDCLRETQTKAEEAGLRATATACSANLGFVHMQSGDAAAALRYYRSALDAYEVDRDGVGAAICRLNVAAAGRVDDSVSAESAITDYDAARVVLAEASRHELAATCLLNIGVERHGIGDLPAAEGDYLAARDQFAALHGQERSVAMCELGLGRLLADRGAPAEARSVLGSARRRFEGLGLEEWAARCSVELSATLEDERAAAGLLPALLALDAIRFQFPTASSRHAWRESTEHATRRAFELADRLGDQRLVAELVETAINSGVHTASMHDSHRDLKTTPDANPAEVLPTAGRTVGTSRLLAGAELPLAPAPGLRMTAERVALIAHRRAARRLYPGLTAQSTARTPASLADVTVSTW